MAALSTNSSALWDLGSDILLLENLLDPAFCAHIVQIAECFEFEPAMVEVSTLYQEARSNDILYLNGAQPLIQSTNQLLLNKIAILQEKILEHYGFRFLYTEACSILRYQVGQQYRRHVDNFLLGSRFEELAQGIPGRDISVVGYLNDDFEGGETYFDRQNIKVKPRLGCVIAFPAGYTHPHQALPVTRGTKYAFNTWLFR